MKAYTKFSFHLVASCLSLVGASAESLDATGSYEYVYAQDKLWPSHVELEQDLYSDEGKRLLRAGLPLVLIRAYEDGMLAIVDRAGTFLIAAEGTNFSSLVATHQAESEKAGNFSNFLNQIGRRVFDFDYDENKAVPEAELSRFEAFLICRTSADEETLMTLLYKLEEHKETLEAKNIEPILVFEEFMKNQEFYDFVTTTRIPHPVVVPIFQKGFLQAVYTEREAGHDFLLLAKSGKRLGASSTLDEALAK
ncbi:hypothetical protein SH580_12180 [Coraliomargarita algicola]|uniref:Uncharacterized protein n=1 Tax=Coraliomargarita algicola TaxID=3092156 RepID=A0ABZ0RG54_9BACT|nr:hypothetical protein [Coraliomargarita sp. J2-16]WPJ94191.1 hypothetical protein SH580_12180 [Coraliomargarita sp. J2-16]